MPGGDEVLVAGIDAGSSTTKAVILNSNKQLISYHIVSTGAAYRDSIQRALEGALSKAKLSPGKLKYKLATGYGRIIASSRFADEQLSEISCCAMGAHHLFPDARTVIDIGGQDTKVILLNSQGRVRKFGMNDKCAAGTGRFLELATSSLGFQLEDLNRIQLDRSSSTQISSLCAVFAQSEIVSLLAQGSDRTSILAGIYEALARRLLGIIAQVGLEPPALICGGVSKIHGVVDALQKELGIELLRCLEPQIVSALGAALIALDRCR